MGRDGWVLRAHTAPVSSSAALDVRVARRAAHRLGALAAAFDDEAAELADGGRRVEAAAARAEARRLAAAHDAAVDEWIAAEVDRLLTTAHVC